MALPPEDSASPSPAPPEYSVSPSGSSKSASSVSAASGSSSWSWSWWARAKANAAAMRPAAIIDPKARLNICHNCQAQPIGCWRLQAPKDARQRLRAGAIAATEGRCPLGKWGEPPPPSAQGHAWLIQPDRGPIDVVYFLGPGSQHDDWELRYSLRSIAKNFLDLGMVFVIGHRPTWLTGVVHIEMPDRHKHNKDANLIEKLVAAYHWGASRWFLNVSDDQILLKPVRFADCRAFHGGDLAAMPRTFWGAHKWKDRLKRTANHLVNHGLPCWHHDCHVPFPIHAETFARIASQADYATPPGFTIHTFYGNSAPIERTPIGRRKVTYEHACYLKTNIDYNLNEPEALFVGYSDAGMTPQFMDEIEYRFPEPSPWEADHGIRTVTPQNRGIVTLAGGPTYTLNAYILCRLLRHYGCRLPIEWFYLGEEMKPAWAAFLQEHVPGLTLTDLGGTGDKGKAAGGWQAKSRAVLRSRFEELLFLDADSHPLRDPTYLFDHPAFRQHGAIFWRDRRDPGPGKRRRIAAHFGVQLARFSESGQMMFDKRRCLKGIERADELNHDPASYSVVYGDKDLFPIGCLQTGTDFAWNPWPNPGHSRMMHPADLDGRKLCSHLVHGKWQTHMRPRVGREHYPMIDLAVQFGHEIAPLLRGET